MLFETLQNKRWYIMRPHVAHGHTEKAACAMQTAHLDRGSRRATLILCSTQQDDRGTVTRNVSLLQQQKNRSILDIVEALSWSVWVLERVQSAIVK